MQELDLDKMRTLREEADLSMDAAAEKAGFPGRQQWWLIESGRNPDVRVSTLGKIAAALNCDSCDLLKKKRRN